MARVYVRKDPDEVATKWFSMRITPKLSRRIQEAVEKTGKTKAVVVAEILERELPA